LAKKGTTASPNQFSDSIDADHSPIILRSSQSARSLSPSPLSLPDETERKLSRGYSLTNVASGSVSSVQNNNKKAGILGYFDSFKSGQNIERSLDTDSPTHTQRGRVLTLESTRAKLLKNSHLSPVQQSRYTTSIISSSQPVSAREKLVSIKFNTDTDPETPTKVSLSREWTVSHTPRGPRSAKFDTDSILSPRSPRNGITHLSTRDFFRKGSFTSSLEDIPYSQKSMLSDDILSTSEGSQFPPLMSATGSKTHITSSVPRRKRRVARMGEITDGATGEYGERDEKEVVGSDVNISGLYS